MLITHYLCDRCKTKMEKPYLSLMGCLNFNGRTEERRNVHLCGLCERQFVEWLKGVSTDETH